MNATHDANESVQHFRLVRKLGEGATGEVWEALNTRVHDRRVAIKFLRPSAMYEFSGELFEREIAALSKLDSPNVIGILDQGKTSDGQAYYVMPFVRGIGFKDLLSDPQLSVDQFFDAIVQLLRGLATIHAAGIKHRDLKPRNVIWSHLGYTIILDFGFAKIKDRSSLGIISAGATPEGEWDTRLTKVGIEPRYFDPLILNGLDNPSIDLYAVGGFIDDAFQILGGRLSAEQKSGLQELIGRLRDKTNTRRFRDADEALSSFQKVFDIFAGRPVTKEEVRLFVIPEIAGISSASEFIRIPPADNVPVTVVTKAVIEHPDFQKLRRLPQLPLAELVFPGATHTRFEHSLGVHLNTLLYIRRLIGDERFRSTAREADIRTLIIASLVHDIGHYPFGHLLEEMGYTEKFPSHLSRTITLLKDPGERGIGRTIHESSGIDPVRVIDILRDAPGAIFEASVRLLRSVLSGPLDADKVDYLQRDSLHAGVPYGMAFDKARLIQSLCLNEERDAIAIAEKGKAALVLLMYGRFVMFSEVYFHHAVRTAVAMLQRAVFDAFVDDVTARFDPKVLIEATFPCAVDMLLQCSVPASAGELARGLFAQRRSLYKRLRTYTQYRAPRDLWKKIEPLGFAERARLGGTLADRLSKLTGKAMAPHHVLVDVPPSDKGADLDVQLYYRDTNEWLRFQDESPAVFGLQVDQYRSSVRKVRVFVHPDVFSACARVAELDTVIAKALGT